MKLISGSQLLVLFLLLSLSGTLTASAVWQDPTANPPGANVPEPINVGSSSQTKEGQLWSNDLLGSYNSGYFQNNIDLGTSPPPTGQQDLQPRIGIGRTADTNDPAWTDALNMLLRVSGKIGATAYCDEDGANCSSPPFGGDLWSSSTERIYYGIKPVVVGNDSGFDPNFASPSAGDLKVENRLQVGNSIIFQGNGNKNINVATSDGSDNRGLWLLGSGGSTPDRGGRIILHGNQYANTGGTIRISSGDSTEATDPRIELFVPAGNGPYHSTATFSKTGIVFDGAAGDNFVINPNLNLWIGGPTAGVKITESATTPWTLTLPANAGTSGQVLSTDGLGNTSWATTGGTGLWIEGANGDYDDSDPIIVGSDTTFDSDLGTAGLGWLKVENKLQVGSEIRFPTTGYIMSATTDGTDNATIKLNGGGGVGNNRGSSMTFYGNEASQPGGLWIESGDTANSKIRINRYGGTGAVTVSQEFNGAGIVFDSSGSASLAINPAVSLWIGGTVAGVKITEGASTAWTLTLPSTSGASGQVLQTNGSGVTSWVNQNTGGEVNTASNLTALSGGANSGLYKQKVGADLQFKGIKAGTGISLDTTSDANSIVISAPNAGTVTSVGLSAPAEFVVSGSPVTTSGTLTLTKADQNANLIYAGPSSGVATSPIFRALVSSDIPGLDTSKITSGLFATSFGGTGQSTYTKGDILVATGATTLTKLSIGSDNQVLTADATQASGVKWANSASSISTYVRDVSSGSPSGDSDFQIDCDVGDIAIGWGAYKSDATGDYTLQTDAHFLNFTDTTNPQYKRNPRSVKFNDFTVSSATLQVECLDR